MKRLTFRIDDGKSKYIEQSTLLEPSNNQDMGSKWEDEEEISSSLAKLRKKHDVVKKQVLKMESNLEKIRKEIE